MTHYTETATTIIGKGSSRIEGGEVMKYTIKRRRKATVVNIGAATFFFYGEKLVAVNGWEDGGIVPVYVRLEDGDFGDLDSLHHEEVVEAYGHLPERLRTGERVERFSGSSGPVSRYPIVNEERLSVCATSILTDWPMDILRRTKKNSGAA